MFKTTTFAIITALSISLGAGGLVAGVEGHDKDKKPATEKAKPADATEKAKPAAAAEPAKSAVEGMLLPFMSPAKGRKLFASKGCVLCHSINGIGDGHATALDASTMSSVMNPFEFAAKMWGGAETMIALQQEELGEKVEFTGEELANIIAFVHSAEEQKKFSKADISPRILKLMEHH